MLARATSDERKFESILVAGLLAVEYRLDHGRIGEYLRTEIAYGEVRISICCVIVGEAGICGCCGIARES